MGVKFAAPQCSKSEEIAGAEDDACGGIPSQTENLNLGESQHQPQERETASMWASQTDRAV